MERPLMIPFARAKWLMGAKRQPISALGWGLFGIRVHGKHNMNTFIVSTGSWRANAHHAGFIQQIGAFHVIRLTMTLSTSPIPPALNQASRRHDEGHIRVTCLFTRRKRLSPCLEGRGSCRVPGHKTGVTSMPAA